MSTLDALSEDERFIVAAVREFVDKDVKPVVRATRPSSTWSATSATPR
ncbi:acyl-CoA dehydrogenase family protein [Streptomyces sp. NBC_01136]|nr:acyl-CoA dehydrogenase family protein [Streptomyces sp. NBC_01136]